MPLRELTYLFCIVVGYQNLTTCPPLAQVALELQFGHTGLANVLGSRLGRFCQEAPGMWGWTPLARTGWN